MHITDQEHADFREWLERKYEAMGREPVMTFVDPLGASRWGADYVWLRASGLSHTGAIMEVNKRIDVILNPPPPSDAISSPITISGSKFLCEGKEWRWIGFSAFALYKQFLTTDTLPFLTSLRSVFSGDAVLRVFGMFKGGLGAFVPSEHPTYYDDLPLFAAFLAEEGFRMEFVIFADRQNVMPNDDEAAVHAQKVFDALKDSPNVFVEWMNEPFKNGNFYRDVQRHGLLTSRGSAKDDVVVEEPILDYFTEHTPRDGEWPRKAKNCYERSNKHNKPAVADEPMGLALTPRAGARTNNPDDLADYFSVAALLGNGGTIHGDFGTETRPILNDEEGALIRAALTPMLVLPENLGDWQYTRGGLSSCPLEHKDEWSLRTFARLSSKESWAVVVRPTEKWKPVPAAGWEITSQPLPHVFYLTRT